MFSVRGSGCRTEKVEDGQEIGARPIAVTRIQTILATIKHHTSLTCPDTHDAFEETVTFTTTLQMYSSIHYSLHQSVVNLGQLHRDRRRWTKNCICSKYQRQTNILIRKPVSARNQYFIFTYSRIRTLPPWWHTNAGLWNIYKNKNNKQTRNSTPF